MKVLAVIVLTFPLLVPTFAYADSTYALSPDGASVVRLTPQTSVSASSLSAQLLSAYGYSVSATSGDTLSTTLYGAGYVGSSGGAKYTALNDNNASLAPGYSLNWIQVINTNSPAAGATSPYLDNSGSVTSPFYTYTVQNTDPTLPNGQLNFYDYSKRPQSYLSTTNPITWSANLYPVIVGPGKSLMVENGVSWGWTMKPAMVGEDTGTFVNPAPTGATVSGVGTNSFSWGAGDPSSLTFSGGTFNTKPNTPFDLGTLTFHNGSNTNDATSVDFTTSFHFDNVPEKDTSFTTSFGLVNTPNTDDPIASADYVTIGNYGFTFNVLEGDTASVDLMAELSTGLNASPTGTADSLIGPDPFEPSPNYQLTIVGLSNPSSGGFTTSVPEPSTLELFASGSLLLLFLRPRKTRRCYSS